MQTKNCRQCKQQFTLDEWDLAFFAKMNLPLPTLCPKHRRQHLLIWRNQRTLYSRTCAVTKKPIISIFAPESPYVVVDRDYWWSDAWDPLSYGAEFDFSKTFAEQFNALMHRVPMVAVFNAKSENSNFCNHVGMMKDCYLSFAIWGAERLYYSDMIVNGKDSMDLLECSEISANGYELIYCVNCYNTKYSVNAEGCQDSWFLYDCRNCSDCIGCTNLRNKKFCIWNEQLTEVEYQKRKAAMRLDTRTGIATAREKYDALVAGCVHEFAMVRSSTASTGNNIRNANNCLDCFSMRDIDNSRRCINGGLGMHDIADSYGVGASYERGYMTLDTGDKGMENICCGIVWGSQYVYYSYNCHTSFELFGCTAVRGKKYCILNKQYTKQEYEDLKPRVITHMRETGEWGEFFPPSIAPFGYNETLSQEYEPLTKEQAVALGFKWQDRVPGTFGHETKKPSELPATIAQTSDLILTETLACTACSKNYKIAKVELEFYRKNALPVPLWCPECRYRHRLAIRLPHELWERQCMHEGCSNIFKTPYAPSRSERVYCGDCYRAEVI